MKRRRFYSRNFTSKANRYRTNKANLYGMETPEGVKNVWGATILDQRMDFVKVGDKVKITFKGLGEKKPGQNAPKIFKVEVDKEDQIETQKIE